MSELKTDPREPSKTVERLLDAAFSLLHHDAGPMDKEYVFLRDALKAKVQKILRAQLAPEKAKERLETQLVPSEALQEWAQITEPGRATFPRELVSAMARELLELRAQLAQAEPAAWHRNAKGSYHEMIFDAARPEGEGWEPFYAAPPCAEPDRLAQCKADTQGPHWAQQAFAALGYLRDKMPSAEVTIVQRFLDAAAPESDKPHTDHPARHWDRTCPACNPAPESEGRK